MVRTGRPLWRRRVAAQTGPQLLCAGRLVVVAQPAPGGPARLIALEPASGQPAWERALPPQLPSHGAQPPALISVGELLITASAGEVRSLRAADGALRWTAPLPFSGPARLAAEDEPDEVPRGPARKWRGPSVVATGPGGAAACFDGNGKLAWSSPGKGDTAAQPALLARGLALVAGGGLRVLDAGEGLLVAQITGPADPALWAAAADLSLALIEGGELRVLRLATHLSVV